MYKTFVSHAGRRSQIGSRSAGNPHNLCRRCLATVASPYSIWSDPQNVRSFFQELLQKLKLDPYGSKGLEAYYDISAENVVNNNGSYLLQRRFGGSVVAALRFAFPEHEWLEWRFVRASNNFWKTPSNRRNYFNWLGKTYLGIEDPSDAVQLEKWYDATGRLFRIHHGAGLLRGYFDDNYIKALKEIYPGHDWITWKFRKVPDAHWASIANQKEFFDYLGSKYLGIEKDIDGATTGTQGLEPWYSAKWSDLRRQEGSLRSILVKYYNSSPSTALATIYPDHKWEIHMFTKEPQGGSRSADSVHDDDEDPTGAMKDLLKKHEIAMERLEKLATLSSASNMKATSSWTNKEQQLDFLRQAEKKLGIQRLDDWYKISQDKMIEIGAGSVLSRHYGGSPYLLLRDILPDHKWIPWKFNKLPRTFWDSLENQRWFLEWAAGEIGLQNLEGWYDVSTRQLHGLGGGFLLNNKYNGSLANALASLYPEHEWLPWEFKTTQARWWSTPENQRAFLDWAQKKLKVTSLHDWYTVGTHDAISSLGGHRLLALHGSLGSALQKAYPDHKWEPWKWKHTQKDTMEP